MEEDRSINNWLSREECTALRTIAILSIVVHNFAHKLPGASSENEFGYNVDNSNYFWNNVISSDFFIHLLIGDISEFLFLYFLVPTAFR